MNAYSIVAMNVIFVSDNSLEVELIKKELSQYASNTHVETLQNTQDVLARVATPGAFDAILLDTSVPSAEAVNLAVAIRNDKKPIGIVVLVEATEKELPTELYNVGVDRFIMKRAGFASLLGEALQQAKERHRAESTARSRQVRVLYAGNIQNLKRHMSGLPQVILEPLKLKTDGTLQLPDSGAAPGDLIIVDSAATGPHTLKAIKEICTQTPDIPTILLSNPGDEDTGIQAMKQGAADCIVKTQNYIQRLLPAIEREIGRRELTREKATIRAREDRLRQIVESMPVGVTVIAPDGTFLAINRTGLKHLGASHIEQVIGKNLIHLLPHDEREQALAFLTTVCGWTSASIRLEWKGIDGKIPGIELKAVPMRREGTGTATVLATIAPHSDRQSSDGVSEELQKKCENLTRSLREYEARFREVQEKYSIQQKKWETALRHVESRRVAAEEQLLKLKSTADEDTNRFRHILEEQRAERANWEQSRQSLKEQCTKIEAGAESLKAAQAGLIEKHKAEQSQWETQRQELEQKLESTEAKIAQLSEELKTKSSQLEAAKQGTEEKYQAAEQQRNELEIALQSAEARLTQQIEEHDSKYSQLDSARKELEQKYQEAEKKRSELETALHNAETQLARQAEERNSERSKLESAQQETEQKYQEAEKQRNDLENALRDAETRLAQQSEERNSERSKLESAQQEFEQKYRQTEQQREELETALREMQTRLAQRAEETDSERSRLDAARQELEQKFNAAEEQRTALENALREAEERAAKLADDHTVERSQWDLARLELDRKYQVAEEQRIALQDSLNKAEFQLSQKAEEQNADISQWDEVKLELEQQIQASEEQRSALRDALHQAESDRAQQTMKYNAERAQWEKMKRDLEQKCQIADEQRSSIETKLRETEAQRSKLADGLNAEQSQWDAKRQELEKKCQVVEEQRSAIEASLREIESRLTQLTEKYEAERSQWAAEKQELEQKYRIAEEQRSAPESALRDAESRIAELTEKYNVEHSQWEQARNEFENKHKAVQEQRSALESTLHETESRLAELTEKYNLERSQWEQTKNELENKYKTVQDKQSALETAFRDSESRLAQLTDQHSAELSNSDFARKELESQYAATKEKQEALEAALRETESRLAQLTEKQMAELSQRDLARKELELRYQTSEKQRMSLQATLHEVETNLTQLTEKHSTELSQHDFAQKKAEQKFQAAEKQRINLEKSLGDAESKIAQLNEKYSVEQALWEKTRRELEEKCQIAEKQQSDALQNAIRETESRLAWISEQNQAKATQLETMQKEFDELQAEYNKVVTGTVDFRLRYQRLSQLTSVGVVLAQQDGLVVECNEAAASMFGYSNAEEALSQTNEHKFRIYAFKGALNTRLHQDGGLTNIEWSSLTRDGRLIRIQEHATLLESSTGGEPLVERILTDITKIHKLSEEMRRARRMESAGDLASATVKGFKDLCASLAHSGELLLESPDDTEGVRSIAESLLNEANRGVKHARQFLSVANKPDRTPALLNLNEILTNNDVLLHSLIGEDIDLQTSLSPGIGLVSADRNEMVQLIGNLLANSREALPLGGALAIETSNIEIDSLASGHPAGLQPGIYVKMMFSADGCAVQPERRTASIRTMVERMSGHLETTNDPKLGNIHCVYLPRVETMAGQTELEIKSAGA